MYKVFNFYYYESRDLVFSFLVCCFFAFVFFSYKLSLEIIDCSLLYWVYTSRWWQQRAAGMVSVTDTKPKEEGIGALGSPWEEVLFLQPLEKPIVRQAVPLQPMLKQFGADFHLQPVENPAAEQMVMS